MEYDNGSTEIFRFQHIFLNILFLVSATCRHHHQTVSKLFDLYTAFTSDTQIIEILKNQIDTLNSQMEKQESRHEITIEFYRKELQKRSKLLENQQILALESNNKIQKLENQLEEEKQLNYSFNSSTNDRENVNAQEAKFTEEVKNVNQQYENQTAEDVGDRNKEVPEESNDSNLEEDELLKNNNASEETKNDHDDKK